MKLIAPDMDAYGSEEMASDEGIVMCNTKPSKLLGKDRNIYKKSELCSYLYQFKVIMEMYSSSKCESFDENLSFSNFSCMFLNPNNFFQFELF